MNNPGRIARLVASLLAAIVGATALAGCGTSGSDSAYYTPATYYQNIGGVNDCYYAQTPLEVTDLINAGLCPANSVATVMPLSWEEMYFAYYSSPAYYDTYMPAPYRSRYTSVTIVHFHTTYSKQISTAETHAVYKSSTGKTTTGTSKVKFGSGSGTTSKTVHGGGSGTTTSCSLAFTVLTDKGSSSTTHGGGSGSKTTTKTGTTTKTKSGSKGGC